MPGHFNQNGSKLKTDSQYVVKNASSSEIIPCLLDTRSTLSIIPEYLVQKYNFQIKMLKKSIWTKQTQGILNLQKVCVVNLKRGHLIQKVEMYVINNDLPYVLIGLPQCK